LITQEKTVKAEERRIQRQQTLAQKVRHLFSTYDVDNSGYLDRSEFESFYYDFFTALVPPEKLKEGLENCLANLDQNNDQRISFNEFSNWWKQFGHQLKL
jgi:Ca2+-binding EF-hand superfamily protein